MADAHTQVTHPSDRELIITRVFDAPRELVFKAWTDPRHLMAWWGPHGFQGTECQLDLRVGGVFRMNLFGPDGNNYPCEGTFSEVAAPERIAFQGLGDDRHPCGGGLPPRATVVVEFDEEDDGRTRLTINTLLETAADKSAAAAGGYIMGWTESLDRFAASLPTMHTALH